MNKKAFTAPTSNATPKRYDVYSVREFQTNGGETKSDWTKLGAAWAHSDGKGFNIVIAALPVDGKLTVRVHERTEGGSSAD